MSRRPGDKLTKREWLQILLALAIAAPILFLWFGVPWIAWVLQFFPSIK